MYTLLRILPAGKVQRRLRKRTRTGLGGGLSLEIKLEVAPDEDTEGSSTDDHSAREHEWGILGFGMCLPLDARPLLSTSFL